MPSNLAHPDTLPSATNHSEPAQQEASDAQGGGPFAGGSALLSLGLIFRRGNRGRSGRDRRDGSFGLRLLGLAEPLQFYAGDAAVIHFHHRNTVKAILQPF